MSNSNGDNTAAPAPEDNGGSGGDETAGLDPVRVEFNKGDEFVKAAKGLSDWLDKQNLSQTVESLNGVSNNNDNNNNINTDEDEENVNMMASIASEHKKLKSDLKNGVS